MLHRIFKRTKKRETVQESNIELKERANNPAGKTYDFCSETIRPVMKEGDENGKDH